MVRTILVADAEEIQKLAEALPSLTSGLSGGSKYVPVFTTGSRQQLVLLQNGQPMMAYRVASLQSAPSDYDMDCILRYMNGFYGRKHLVMLYDNPDYARKLEFLYVKQGLEKTNAEGRSIYILPDDDVESIESIRKQMEEFGIDTEYHLGNGSLKIEKIEDPSRDSEGFRSGCERIFQALTTETRKQQSRTVLHVKYRFGTEELSRQHAAFEAVIESSFAARNYNGSMLCNHYIGDYDGRHEGWKRRMLQTHDGVFLISSKGLL